MTKIDNFKEFVRNNPNLISYVHQGEYSWQYFYELYDLYGENNDIWNKYLSKKEEVSSNLNSTTNDNRSSNNNTNNSLGNIVDMVKKLDPNKLQDGLSSVQKAIDLFGGLLVKDKSSTSTYNPRPVYKRFDD